MTFFLYKATQAPLQGNWALVMFVSFWPLAAAWYQTVCESRFWRWSTASAFIIPAVCVLFLAAHLLHPMTFIPAEGDRVTRQYALNDATHQIAETIHQRGESLPVFTTTYQLTAWLRFQSLDGRQIDQISRPSHFTQHPEHLTDVNRAYVVAEFPLPATFAEGFGEPELVGDFPVRVRGEAVRDLKLYMYTKSPEVKRTTPRVAMVNHVELAPEPATLSEAQLEETSKVVDSKTDKVLRLRIFKMSKSAYDDLGLREKPAMYVPAGEYDRKLKELVQAGRIEVVAEPKLPLKLDQASRFFTGEEFPIPIPVPGGELAVEWRECGIEAEVTLLPESEGQTILKLYFSVSERDMANAVEINGLTVPGISRRRSQSTFAVSPNDPRLAGVYLLPNDEKCVLFRYELCDAKAAITSD